MLTCPNCGAKISPNDVFCQNCGYRLKPATTSTNQPSSFQPEPTPVAPQPTTSVPTRNKRRKSGSHKKAIWISLVVLIIVILAGTYLYGSGKYSKSRQVDDMITAMHDNDTDTTVKYMTSTDPSLEINSKSIKPFMSYLTSDKRYLADMKSSLMANDQTSDGTFKLVTKGHHLLFFPAYKLAVVAMYPTVQTNVDQATISLNGLNVATASNDHYSYKAGPLFPGRYTFKLANTGSTADGKSVTKNLVSTQSKNIKVDLSTPDTTDSTDTTDSNTDVDSNDNSDSGSDTDDSGTTPSDSNYGHFEEEYHGDEQSGIDAIADQYGFDYDDYTYVVSWPHKDVLQVKAYDKDTHDYDSTYRYDQIHDISSLLNEDTGKFEE
ncbi:zinc-ribbon domain-containing protein [Lactobacillus sp. LC28-10]|uniref:Zinc-ribbon domain-containing protein n=1 Tax=Secundilactobacillus angelensis TaxID=2722706 RepID=A0ABX1L372_9LACO|nr:zinc-ribbon domain-containing protein [Secundilactobacillus angelensis]MCH5463027.1 zinc-ribbon domain-containing protein [Secundilactobacillus angelensis]NLR19493.1 zinc-ribbon domain-containing protein [Secundilactobacillus angelensis]